MGSGVEVSPVLRMHMGVGKVIRHDDVLVCFMFYSPGISRKWGKRGISMI